MNRALVLIVAATVPLAACGRNPVAPTIGGVASASARTPSGIAVVSSVSLGTPIRMKVGDVVQLRASASFTDGTQSDITSLAV
jgi:hypothetical protein